MLTPYLTSKKIEYWFGLTDKLTEGTWRWESGLEAWKEGYSNDWKKWKQGEPNDKNGEDCAAVGYSDGWATVLDIDCGEKRPVVCVKMTCKFHKLLHMNYLLTKTRREMNYLILQVIAQETSSAARMARRMTGMR